MTAQANGSTGSRMRLFWEDLRQLRPALRLVSLFAILLPSATFGWLRPILYRVTGVKIGSRCRIFGKLDITGQGPVVSNIRIGELCMLTTPLYLNASAPITIGDRVGIGHHVVIITDGHDMQDPHNRCGPGHALPVTVEDGVWIGARVTILPGVTLRRGSVVAAGSVVARDVPEDTLVGGSPARAIRRLPGAKHELPGGTASE